MSLFVSPYSDPLINFRIQIIILASMNIKKPDSFAAVRFKNYIAGSPEHLPAVRIKFRCSGKY